MSKTVSASVTLTVLAALGAVGCGSRSTPAETADQVQVEAPPQVAAEPPPQPAPGELLIYSFTMGDHTGDDLVLHEDGRLVREASGQDLGVVRPDGSFTDPSGALLARLEPDGTVVLADGTTLNVMLTPQGTLRRREGSGGEVRIRDDGAIVGVGGVNQGEEQAFGEVRGYRAEGHRTAIFVLALATELFRGE
jgi:hypothetical protein